MHALAARGTNIALGSNRVCSRQYRRLSRTIATICVAITCMFCVQTVVIALDRIEHALELEHDANPLAGPVHYCAVSDNCEHPGSGPGHPVSHSHLGDNGTNALAVAPQALVPVEFVAVPLMVVGTPGFSSLEQAAPERPPKSLLDHVS